MKRKQTIKQLMAIGIQRNDAAAFAKAYRKVIDAKMEHLFPEIVKPIMPVMGTVCDCQIETIRASSIVHRQMAFPFIDDEEFATVIPKRLGDELVENLIQSGAAVLQMRPIDAMRIKYVVTVRVAMTRCNHGGTNPDGR